MANSTNRVEFPRIAWNRENYCMEAWEHKDD